MKLSKEYQASQILKKKILIKFLWLEKINTFIKWGMMALLFAFALYFVLVNTGAILSQGAMDQVNFAKPALFWPLIVVFVYIAGIFAESVLSWEAKKRQRRDHDSSGFANIDLTIKRTKIRIIVQAATIVVSTIMFGVWFHIIQAVYPGADKIFFDSAFGTLTPGVTAHESLHLFASLFITGYSLLTIAGLSYIGTATYILIKNKNNVIFFKQIKAGVVDEMATKVK